MEVTWLHLIPLLPLAGFLLNASFGRRISKGPAGAIACGAILASFVASADSNTNQRATPTLM